MKNTIKATLTTGGNFTLKIKGTAKADMRGFWNGGLARYAGEKVTLTFESDRNNGGAWTGLGSPDIGDGRGSYIDNLTSPDAGFLPERYICENVFEAIHSTLMRAVELVEVTPESLESFTEALFESASDAGCEIYLGHY